MKKVRGGAAKTLALGIVFGVILVSSGRADVALPSAFSTVTTSTCSNSGYVQQTCTSSVTIDTNVGPTDISQAASTNLGFPAADAQLALSTYGGFFGQDQASASLTYYFEVSGPNGANALINLAANGDGAVIATGDVTEAAAVASVTVGGVLLGRACGILGTEYECTGVPFAQQTSMSVLTNSVISIQLDASAQGGTGDTTITPGDNEILNVSAYADPYITIDPAQPFADEFSLIFSDGVGNSPSTVPEPSTWGVMLIGCLGLRAVVHRRPKAAAIVR
jgi:hypothetical protein